MKILFIQSPRNLVAAILLIGVSSMLAGCSKEPSASDIDKLIRADLAVSKNVEIFEIRKIGCAVAQGAVGYMCDVEVDAKLPNPFGFPPPQRSKKIIKLRFFEDGGNWKASPN